MNDTIITNTPRPGETAEQTAARNRDPLLQERQKTHGSFELNAHFYCKIQEVFRDANHFAMSPVYRNSLDMIALKLSRILSGQADFKDHWDDIAGYAKLAAEVCQKSQ